MGLLLTRMKTGLVWELGRMRMATQLLLSMGMLSKAISVVLPSAVISLVATGLALTSNSTFTFRVPGMRALLSCQEPKPRRSGEVGVVCSGRRAATFAVAEILAVLGRVLLLPVSVQFRSVSLASIKLRLTCGAV